jgi:hypothetical protein
VLHVPSRESVSVAFAPLPVHESVPLAVPLVAAAFAAAVFARHRRPSRIVVLGISRPERASVRSDSGGRASS